ncbi:MAG: LPS export ABC transporter permease LptF [Gammaproteobacteria bacterium]|nr:LPS export ABC transporter permease LptF [Gammaproteobacteria bacterium]MDJ0871815.1 LPS export ABC transporter permease LptF [Gammaproteobacteria bacterium]MDJ0892862.1 LPS export ABC transporter permease LptF [Gammaproteobacteria bacterium]
MIIERYLLREITQPMILGVLVLVIIYASFSSANYLAEAVAGVLPAETLVSLILLRILIGFEVLLPTALYLSVVVGLGRLYTDSEMVAITAAGVSDFRVLKTVFRLTLTVAILVALLALFARPWAYRTGYELEARAQAGIDMSKLEAGRFYELKRSGRVLYAEDIDAESRTLKRVFYQSRKGKNTQVVYAREAILPAPGDAVQPNLVFVDGHAYHLAPDGQKDMTVKFGTLSVYLKSPTARHISYKRRAAPTAQLARSDRPKDIAEFQWRVSAPIGTMLLTLLAVPLSRTAPRRGRYARVFVAVLVYVVYYNLGGMAETWVEEGWVGEIPGMMWVHSLPAALLLLLLWWPVRPAWCRRRMSRIQGVTARVFRRR